LYNIKNKKMATESWRDVPNYNNLYQVSDLGNIKTYGNNLSNASQPRLLKPWLKGR